MEREYKNGDVIGGRVYKIIGELPSIQTRAKILLDVLSRGDVEGYVSRLLERATEQKEDGKVK